LSCYPWQEVGVRALGHFEQASRAQSPSAFTTGWNYENSRDRQVSIAASPTDHRVAGAARLNPALGDGGWIVDQLDAN
jgi:hypothetical protein